MSRYIDAECGCVTEVINRRAFNSREDVQDFLDNIPTADVAPVKHGHWEYDRHFRFAECSECEAEFYICDLEEISGDGFINFCPNCGTKMDGGDNTG